MFKRRVRVSEQTDRTPTADAPDAPAEAASSTADAGMDDTAVIGELQKQAQAYLEGWQRERAEFANYKKRTDREKLDLYQTASSDVLKNLLPVLDDFERAFSTLPADLKDHAWVNGMTGIQRKMLKLLESFEIATIDPTGQPFDPAQHEAIIMEDSDQPSGTVTVTLQRGYRVGERVLRPALVRVAR